MIYKNNFLKILLAAILYIALVPGFFLYHYAIQLGLNPFLGGYTSASAITAGLIAITIFILNSKWTKLRLTPIDIAFTIAITWKLFYATISYLDAEYSESAIQSINGLIIYISLYFSFRYIFIFRKNLRLVFVGSILAIIAIFYIQKAIDSYAFKINAELATYQSFGLFFLISAYSSSMEVKGVARLIIGVATIISLFLIGARTEFFIGLVFFAVILVSNYRISSLLAALVMAFTLHFMNLDATIFEAIETNSRILDAIENTSTSGSYTQREVANGNALRTIRENPILGDFGSYSPGNYAHNILSAWVDYGIIGFILHISVFIVALFSVYNQKFYSDRIPAIIMLSLIIAAEIFLKYHTYLLSSVFLGYLTSIISTCSENKSPRKSYVFG